MSQHYSDGPATGPLQAPPYPPQHPTPRYDDRAYDDRGDDGQGFDQGYDPAYDQGYNAYPAYDLQRPRTNVMAILGLIFAFIFSPLGIIFSAIGLRQIKRRREGGRGLAIAGLVVSIVLFLIGLLVTLIVIPAVLSAVKHQEQTTAADAKGVKTACSLIVPAMLTMETDVAKTTTQDEYAQVIHTMRVSIGAAAQRSTDPVFVQDVQKLSADFVAVVHARAAGADMTALQQTLTTDGTAIDNDCAAAGYGQK
jgi:hypothetical protein